jgi:hypothetical protein
LQVGAEMYFHSLENRDSQDYCQYDTAWRSPSRTTLAVPFACVPPGICGLG